MKKLVLLLSLIAANTAMADISECLPSSRFEGPSALAAKAFLNKDENTITVILKDGKSVSGKLVSVMNHGPTAIGFSREDAAATGIDVTVGVTGTQISVFVSPVFAMSIPQHLACK